MVLTSGADSALAGYEDGSVVWWDIDQRAVKAESKLYQDSVMALDYNSLVNRGVAGSVNNKLEIFKLSESEGVEHQRTVTLDSEGVSCVCIRDDGRLFCVTLWSTQCLLYSMKKCQVLAQLTAHSTRMQCLLFTSDKHLLVAGDDGAISVWSVYTN